MNIAIVTNMNGIGLTRDYELLSMFLAHLGHIPTGVQYDSPVGDDERYDLAIYLEVVPRNMLGLSERRWFFGNPEWCKPDIVQIVDRSFEKIFAKTHEAERIFGEVFPGRVHYVGFLARDQYDPNVRRRPWFLHVGGNSSLRGTQTVLDAWKWKKNGKTLESTLIVISKTIKNNDFPPHIKLYERLDEDELKVYQNTCLYHIYPSGTEGYGHAIHEALSVGAALILTGRPPMLEIGNAFYLSSCGQTKYNLANVWEVSALEIIEAVECVMQMNEEDVREQDTRQQFLDGNESFKELFGVHLEEFEKKAPAIVRKKSGKNSVAFLGNFEAPESTENMIKWALTERLNYEVEMLQENSVNMAAIKEAMAFNDAFLWVHTHGWLQISSLDMGKIIDELKWMRLPSISMHLDKYWGLPEREDQIGVHPFWKTDHVWTADGSRQEDFKKRGVNHHWMKPAVSEVYCHPGTPRDYYRCDVLFVGAKAYHREYPFRGVLLDFLEKEYGDRFRHINTVRGHELNDIYASAKIVVGDCIFSGTPNYWSDRVPETCGRYGFLLHPKVEGLDIPMAQFFAQNLEDLRNQIEFWLEAEHTRKQAQTLLAEHVHKHDTWTIRLAEIFRKAGLPL